MAVLESGNLKVEIKFIDDFEANYSLQFFYDSLPLINPEIMGEGFLGYDEGDSLTPALEESLLNDGPNVWNPIGPAGIVEIRFFPKCGWKDQMKGSRVTPEYEEYLKKVDQLRIELGGKLPDDYFEMTFLADVHGLKIPYPRDMDYIRDYVAIRISVTREALQHFVNTLKEEYGEFLEREKDKLE